MTRWKTAQFLAVAFAVAGAMTACSKTNNAGTDSTSAMSTTTTTTDSTAMAGGTNTGMSAGTTTGTTAGTTGTSADSANRAASGTKR